MLLVRLLSALILPAVFLAPAAALAQETSPEPAEDEEECRAGELCGSGTRENRFQDDNRLDAPDPPGNYARSLVTLGLIAAVVGGYLFIALTGRSVLRRRPKRS